MRNIRITYLLSLFLAVLQTTQTQVTSQPKEKTESQLSAEEKIAKKIKLIPESHVKIINMIFTEAPIYTLKIQGAYKKALQILKELEPKTEIKIKTFNQKYNTQEKIQNLVLQRKEEIIRPVRELFPLLHLKEYRIINEPLFINILVKEKTQNEIKSKTKKSNVSLEDIYKHIEEKQIPMGLKFLKSDEKTAQTFFEDFIVDKETLITCCKEFDTLFGPFNKMLTKETKTNAVEYYKELINKSKQK